MKNFFVFLFIFMFFSPKTGGSGFIKKIETNKKEFVYTKTVRQSNLKDGRNCDFVVDTTLWHKASASFYDPHDQVQTKNDLNGIGAFGRQVSSGSVALGSSITKTLIKKGIVVFIEVHGMEHIKTPYGDGVFRVDDKMGDRFSKENKFYVDFHQRDLNNELRRLGRFKIRFRFKFKPAHESGQFLFVCHFKYEVQGTTTAEVGPSTRSDLVLGPTSAVIHRF